MALKKNSTGVENKRHDNANIVSLPTVASSPAIWQKKYPGISTEADEC
jgi:hypothetical protein